MVAAQTLLLAFVVPSSAFAQADRPDASDVPSTFRPGTTSEQWGATAFGRMSWFQNGDALDDIFGWDELFHAGIGGGLEISYFWTGPRAHRGGLYVSFQAIEFEGNERTDNQGDSIDPESLTVGLLLVGGKMAMNLAPGMDLEFEGGLGAAYFDEVLADASIQGQAFKELEVFENSGAFAAETTVRAGLGPFQIGAGVRYLGPPKLGSDFTDAAEPEASFSVYAEVALTFTF